MTCRQAAGFGSCWGRQEDRCWVCPSGAPWLKRLGAFLSPRGPGFDRGCAGHSDTGTAVFSPFCSLPCQHHSTLLHTHLHLHVALTRRKNGLSLGTFHKTVIFRHAGSFTKHKKLLCFGGRISGFSFSSFTPKKAGSAVVMPCHYACQLARQAITRLFCFTLSVCLPVFGRKLLPPAVISLPG
jgi:hypothetical protein